MRWPAAILVFPLATSLMLVGGVDTSQPAGK